MAPDTKEAVPPTRHKGVNYSLYCVIVGVVLICCGGILLALWPLVSRRILTEVLKVSPDSKSYEGWVESQIPNYMDFYLFNWTNPHDISDPNKKLVFKEMGPYRFLEKVKKTGIVFNDHNNTVTYKRVHHWFFDEKNSKGKLSDTFTTINQVSLSAAYIERVLDIGIWNFGKMATIHGILRQRPLEINLTVSQILFEGHSDVLITISNAFSGDEYDKYGFFYKKNGSSKIDGVYNVGTGADDFLDAAVVKAWNYAQTTNFYSGNCNDIKGTTGERFPLANRKDVPLEIFSNSMCRSIDLLYEGEEVFEDILAFRYRGRAEWYDNGTADPQNECYCGGECLPSGVLNTSACHENAPIFASYPHFYKADPFHLQKIEGLSPDQYKHDFYMLVEPQTGIPIDVAARVQINILMQPYKKFTSMSNLPQLIFPLIWLDQRATITPDLAGSLRHLLMITQLGQLVAVVFFILGSGMLLTVVLWHLRDRRIRQKTKTNNSISLTSRRSG